MGTSATSAKPSHDRNAQVHAFLARQHDAVAYWQLASIGISRASVRRRVAANRLYEVWNDVYSGRPLPLRGAGVDWATWLSGTPDDALSSLSAAHVLDLTKRRPHDGLHLVGRDDGRRAPRRITRHRTVWLPEDDVVEVQGLRCTSTARTLLDCAELVNVDRLDAMLDRAVHLQLFDADQLAKVLNDRPGVRGARRLLEAIGRLDDTAGRHRTELERRVSALIRASTVIGMPAVNARVGEFESDFWFPGTRAMVEADGRDFHRTPAQIERDLQRERAYVALGFAILRVGWNHVTYEKARTLVRIEQFALANTAPPIPGTTGRVVF